MYHARSAWKTQHSWGCDVAQIWWGWPDFRRTSFRWHLERKDSYNENELTNLPTGYKMKQISIFLGNSFLSWKLNCWRYSKDGGYHPCLTTCLSNWHPERFHRKRVLLWYCWFKGYLVTAKQRIHLQNSPTSWKAQRMSWQLTIPITSSCSLCEKVQNSSYKLLFWRSKGSWMCLCVLSMRL